MAGFLDGWKGRDQTQKQAKKDQASAKKRAPIVNRAINKRNTTSSNWTSAKDAPRSISLPKITRKDVANFFNGKPTAGQQKAINDYRNNSNRIANRPYVHKSNATSVLRAENARQQYMNAGLKNNRDSNIVQSVKNFFTTGATESQKQAMSDYGYSFNGQYGSVGKMARDIYESNLPVSVTDYARNAAKRDTTQSLDDRDYYDERSLDQEKHEALIAWGQDIMVNEAAVRAWLLSTDDPDEISYRLKQYENYMKEALQDVDTYNPNTHEFGTESQFKPNAALPPWVRNTHDNIDKWNYYITYSHDVVQSAADAYRDEMNRRRDIAKHPYKSAISTDHSMAAIDSYADILIKSRTPKEFLRNTSNYMRDYILNPLAGGHVLTAAGNALWNLMDTMDIAARGVRAFVAGDTALGGAGGTWSKDEEYYYDNDRPHYGQFGGASNYKGTQLGHGVRHTSGRNNDAKFKGQKVYWAQLKGHELYDDHGRRIEGEVDEEAKRAQRLFMDNGGYALLLKANPSFASKAQLGSEDMAKSKEELTAKLDSVFRGSDIDWHDIYNDINENYYGQDRGKKDLMQAFENIKEAYSRPDAAFNADTGSTVGDIFVESVLDPGLLVEGVSKSIVKGTVANATDTAIRTGLRDLFKGSSDDVIHNVMGNKNVNKAIRQFMRNNEGTKMMFKGSSEIANNVDTLILQMRKEFPELLSTDAARDLFRRDVTAHLVGGNRTLNAEVMKSVARTQRDLNGKLFKSARFMGNAIDTVDSAIIKSAFAAPWAVAKVIPKGVDNFTKLEAVKEVLAQRQQRLGDVARAIADEKTGNVDVTNIDKLVKLQERGLNTEKEVRRGMQEIVAKYDEAEAELRSITARFAKGEVDDEAAIESVRNLVRDISGGKYKSVEDMSGHLRSIEVRYAGDAKNAYDRLLRANNDMLDLINHRSEKATAEFLDKARQVQSVDELRTLFREYSDNKFIMELRDDIVDKAKQIDGLTVDDVDNIVNEVRTGMFSTDTATRKDIAKGLEGFAKVSDKSIERSIDLNAFKDIIRNTNIKQGTIEDRKIAEFMRNWSENPSITYSTQDMLRQVTKWENSVRFSKLLDPSVTSAGASLTAHKEMAVFNKLRKSIKKMDVINLKNADVVVIPQLDRMALYDACRNNQDIEALYSGEFYDNVIKPFVDKAKIMTTDGANMAESSFIADIQELAAYKYGHDRTTVLMDQARNVAGLSDTKAYVFQNTIVTSFFKDTDLEEWMLSPGSLRRKLEAGVKAKTGESKVGMKNITDMLQSAGGEGSPAFMEPYLDELADPAIKARYDAIVNRDTLDPRAYVEKQMLATALMDPSVIPEWNASRPIGCHINTTGLNTEINSITSVSFKRWTPIELAEGEKPTLSKILDAFESEDTVVFQRYMDDTELNEVTENVFRRMDMKGTTKAQMLDVYKQFYGVSEVNSRKSESQMLEEVCAYLQSEASIVDGKLSTPPLVVHDLDGFNVPFLNNKIGSVYNSADRTNPITSYMEQVATVVRDNQINTYDRWASSMGDYAYTDEEFQQITELLANYITDINRNAPGYRMMDLNSYSRKLQEMVRNLELNYADGAAPVPGNPDEVEFLKRFREANGGQLLNNYNTAFQNVSKLSLEPHKYAYTLSGNFADPVASALAESGRTSVNVNSYIRVNDVLSYFNLDVNNGYEVAVEDLKKMHDMASYIINKRDTDITAGAVEYLARYKNEYDTIIQGCIDTARKGDWGATELAYMRDMKVPDNPVESYLMAQKLYNDHLRYWLDSDGLTSLRREGADLDALKSKIFELRNTADKLEGGDKALLKDISRYESDNAFLQACDYTNNYRRRFMDELVGGGFDEFEISEEAFDILQGAHRPEIFKSAAKSDFEKTTLQFRDGVLKYGLDQAAKLSEAGSEISSGLRDLDAIDSVFTTMGLGRKQDRLLGSTYMKAKQLFDMLDETGYAKRPSFEKFFNKASELYQLRLQNYRYQSLLNDAGKIDEDKLLSELVYNGFNMSVFNSHSYSVSQMQELRRAVKRFNKGGTDFLSIFEDKSTGNVFVYLNDACEISTGLDGTRYINRSKRIEKPVKDAIGFAEFDEVVKYLDEFDDFEDYREIYNHLLSCWEDTKLLSDGMINGTSGRAVSFKQSEEFLASLPSGMNDWLTSEGLLKSEMARGVVYDPGFAINQESNMLLDYLDTLHRQADIAKDECIIINETFNKTNSVQFGELAEHFTDDELVQYFGNNPDYVVCTITANPKTHTGFQVRQLNVNNRGNLQAAKTMENTTILPYDVYFEIADTMNRTVGDGDNFYKNILGKYLLAYKAFALVRPGTWMRNYIDATMKAAIDNGEGVSNVATLLQYESKAVKYINTYQNIIKSDPALLSEANWNIVQRTFKTDMTYREWELLKGVIDGDQYMTASGRFIDKTKKARGGFDVISGKYIGVRNLEEADIKTAFNKYLKTEPDLPLKEKEFLDIYLKKEVPDEATSEAYEDMMRRLTNNMRNASAGSTFDKATRLMFKPFATVENVVRYAQTMYLTDMGLSANQTLKHIHNTQFYTAPTWGAFNKLETIMPFITFKYNNFMYWMKMMDENPRFFRVFENIYGNITEDTLESMQAQGQELDYENDFALRDGAIPIGNGQTYFKVGNTFLDAINTFYGLGQDFDSLNPLIRDAVKLSMYALGLNSTEFFSNANLEMNFDDRTLTNNMLQMIPGVPLVQKGYKTFKNVFGASSENGGPSTDFLFATLNYAGVIGERRFRDRSGAFSFDDWQDELAAQGKWYDCNLGKIVDISRKNNYGANSDANTFEDIQAYMLTHYGKLWDANVGKFVLFEDYTEGGYNDGFDWDTDPEKAWADLQAYMWKMKGKKYDYNQRKFVLPKDYQSGGLNDANISFDEKVKLMEELFPNMKWDANQNSFVESRYYISGGLNDIGEIGGGNWTAWNQLKGYRKALFGETYDKASHSFVKTDEPDVVLLSEFFGIDRHEKYDRYFSRLAIPSLMNTEGKKLTVSREGLLMTSDGKYVITGNAIHDAKVFEKFAHTFDRTYGGRGRNYHKWKKYSYNKTRKPKKSWVNTYDPYQTGYGWNADDGYYRLEYSQEQQYCFSVHVQVHNSQPARRKNYLSSPHVHYPYGGGYGKYSFYMR